jgi:hypothetical protein
MLFWDWEWEREGLKMSDNWFCDCGDKIRLQYFLPLSIQDVPVRGGPFSSRLTSRRWCLSWYEAGPHFPACLQSGLRRITPTGPSHTRTILVSSLTGLDGFDLCGLRSLSDRTFYNFSQKISTSTSRSQPCAHAIRRNVLVALLLLSHKWAGYKFRFESRQQTS